MHIQVIPGDAFDDGTKETRRDGSTKQPGLLSPFPHEAKGGSRRGRSLAIMRRTLVVT